MLPRTTRLTGRKLRHHLADKLSIFMLFIALVVAASEVDPHLPVWYELVKLIIALGITGGALTLNILIGSNWFRNHEVKINRSYTNRSYTTKNRRRH